MSPAPPDYARIWQALDATCRRHDYAGWDPFDGLNSRLFAATPLAKSAWCRLAWLQLFKRLPINLRPLTGIPRRHNAKALALFVRSYLQAGEKEKARHCLQLMLNLRSEESRWGKAAWGYPFDWQAKAFFVPQGEPNVICTTYCTLAIEAAAEHGLIDDASPYITAAADFVLAHLPCDNEQGYYLAYIPGSTALVHNASLWGAYLLCRAYAASGEEKYREAAEKAIATSLKAQGEKGEWIYGTMPHHHFIDGFHTGYNLEALYRCNQILQRQDIAQAIERGMEYYMHQFFDAHGRAAYYHNNPYPLDPHSSAQAILTIQLIAPERYMAERERIARYCCENLWNERGSYFYYQRHRRYTNRLNYLRWTQAWMHLALVAL